ncbi:DUF488 family protein [Lysobacter sp. TY2-98]|uniref:DUF488 domain-containing protein n=1 Tax=Lysobacter sp. TY2-98 TaxID=2290922 RepID=UPI000E2078EE|nr:DUF488 family protein [Lysobacter sp. TY2-98]AXK72920.1 DUF488 family protein [Lysobacter sp. TY2-98]
MAIRIVRLGSPRHPGEGTRLGTVRRPPRGVRKDEFATRDFYDVWLPTLAPQPETVAAALSATTPRELAAFVKRYRSEMGKGEARHVLDTLAALSHTTDFSVGCYCADPARCHRSILRDLLAERGAAIVDEPL